MTLVKSAHVQVPGMKAKEVAQLPILMDGGPLCVAGVWNWYKACTVAGLWLVYHKQSGIHIGPYHTSIPLAEKTMKKALTGLPTHVWNHDLEWYRNELWLAKWMEGNLGKHTDLIGGEWEKESK